MSKPIVVAAISISIAACSTGTTPADAPTTGNSAAPAATAATPADEAGLRAAVTALFAPYAQAGDPPSAEDLPYTAATAALVSQWRQATRNAEIIFLADFDWLCQCQDWDAATFRITGQQIEWTGDDRATVTVNYSQSANSSAQLRLMMAREGGAWKIADMEFAEGDKLLTTHLREEIAEARRSTGASQ